MKGLFLSLCLILIFSISHAQLRVAIVGGAHQSKVTESGGPVLSSQGYKGRTGGHIGFMADMPLNNMFSFQPGVQFYTRGRKFADSVTTPTNGDVYQTRKQFINYIDIPLNITAKFHLSPRMKFIMGAGPYASLFYNGKETSESFGQNSFFQSSENNDLPVGKNPGQYRILNFGANALAGIEGGKVFVTINYTRGLNDFYESKDYAGSFKHSTIGGTLGIFIGKPVEPAPKVKDQDKDGIPDDQDNCPDLAGAAITHGCPDKDGDGIADKDDQCPDKPGTLANKGCPITDRDNDGVNDDVDHCPDVPGLSRFDGCPPPDTDGDGISDEDDKCPTVAGVGRYNGCPVPDRDGDGINDEEDKCPDQAGTSANNGCPEEVQKEIVQQVNYAARKIQFRVNKSELLPVSYLVLDNVAAIMEKDANLKLSIEGHTSADGNAQTNQRLSQARADNVKAYLISKGVDASRLDATGFGSSKPLNAGRTAAERGLNRRVELLITY